MSDRLRYITYLGSSFLDRLCPLRPSIYAENTLNRYDRCYGGTVEYRDDQWAPKGRSVYWRIVAAVQRERRERQRCAERMQGGFVAVWRRTTMRMVILGITVHAAEVTVPWAVERVVQRVGVVTGNTP